MEVTDFGRKKIPALRLGSRVARGNSKAEYWAKGSKNPARWPGRVLVEINWSRIG